MNSLTDRRTATFEIRKAPSSYDKGHPLHRHSYNTLHLSRCWSAGEAGLVDLNPIIAAGWRAFSLSAFSWPEVHAACYGYTQSNVWETSHLPHSKLLTDWLMDCPTDRAIDRMFQLAICQSKYDQQPISDVQKSSGISLKLWLCLQICLLFQEAGSKRREWVIEESGAARRSKGKNLPQPEISCYLTLASSQKQIFSQCVKL